MGTGDSAALLLKDLSQDVPDNALTPNYDTDRDAIPGLSLAPTAAGWSESDTAKIQRFGLGASGDHLIGPVIVTFYAAIPDGGTPATLDFALTYCDGVTWAFLCNNLAVSSATVTSTVSDGFQALTINFGTIDHTLSTIQPDIVLRVTTSGAQTLHTAFDSDAHPSQIEMTVIRN